MEVVYFGHSCFRIKGRAAVILTDPYDPKMVGISYPKTTADVVTVSHEHNDHNFLGRITEDYKVISGPGEYEISGVSVVGVSTFHDDKKGEERGKNTVYVITIDGIHICHLGDLGHRLSENQLEEIGTVDILLVPVGGYYTIDSGVAAEVVSSIEPSVVVPMHYFVSGMDKETFGKLDKADAFIKELGLEPTTTDKYQITYDKLPEEMQLVVLNPKGV